MILVLDCETNGLPQNYNAPLDDFTNWPRAVQIGWATFNNDGTRIAGHNRLVKPDNWTIPEEASRKNGLTTEVCQIGGIPVALILGELAQDVLDAEYIVAHNADFDKSIIGSEYMRAGRGDWFVTRRFVCTMKTSTEYCAIDNGRGGYKWPKLGELYDCLFPGEKIEHEHDALSDALACARCFFELVKRGVIHLDEPVALPRSDSEIKKLASLRKSITEIKTKRDNMLKKVTEDVEYQSLGKQLAELATAEGIVVDTVRNQAMAQFRLDQVKKPEGAGWQVKEFKSGKLTYDPGAALAYCMTDLKAALALDVKAFESVAKTGKLPETVVKVEDDYRVQIDSDLSAFLKE